MIWRKLVALRTERERRTLKAFANFLEDKSPNLPFAWAHFCFRRSRQAEWTYLDDSQRFREAVLLRARLMASKRHEAYHLKMATRLSKAEDDAFFEKGG